MHPFCPPFRMGGGVCLAMVQNEICEIYLLEVCERERERESKGEFFHDIFYQADLKRHIPPPFSSSLSAGRMEGRETKGGREGWLKGMNECNYYI